MYDVIDLIAVDVLLELLLRVERVRNFSNKLVNPLAGADTLVALFVAHERRGALDALYLLISVNADYEVVAQGSSL